ncbi:phage tail assembly protein [uncultured Roseibium sp.]|uniref:phage tail assembly protein n=1 Tax=uncultured Roseibium sp. TaxID=1936171 RepID=UPI00262F8417|nr:phage tail assembly protein [uncultured Roseibium sp.]
MSTSEKNPGKTASVTLPLVIALSEAVSVNDVDYTELTFKRKRKVRDLLAADAHTGQLNKVNAVYASMAGVPIDVILDLDADDYDDLESRIEPLMGKKWQEVAMGFLAAETMNETLAAGVREEMQKRAQASA